ncbi:hypothetical protein MoryE10_19880 [Methylogaea oryzae]|uniref:HTH cro/C1-type domain-containing protein n=2 Tax=Methylogaea oryzae TaxID=1295382 RepID=A0A8D4VRR0_9GAMM|nr:hypothetical protein MoryE10_19880 [Methylogaea oryzae]
MAARSEPAVPLTGQSAPALNADRPACNETLAATIGRNVRRLREENDLSLERLARLAEVEPAALRHIETASREPAIGELWKIARIFQVSCVSLLSEGEAGPAVAQRGPGSAAEGRQGSGAIVPFPLR